MAADLRKMQENQWVSEIRIDKLEFGKGESHGRLRKLTDLCPNRCCWKLFRLGQFFVLSLAKAVPAAPRHIVGSQQQTQIEGIDVQRVDTAGYSGCSP